MADTGYSFFPWVRQGLAAAGLLRDPLDANLAARATLPIEVRVNERDLVQTQARLYGPGDVIGIDRRQVVRTEPRNGTNNFEPNYLAAIEFDRPDFPWLFTPAAADTQDRLRPWLCLVIVRQQPGVNIAADPNRPLPTLTIKAPAQPRDELPDLAEAWAWAHAQVAGALTGGPALEQVLADHPERTISRLLCPRRLATNSAYLACVVPAFEIGRKAGLGLPIDAADEAALQLAWRSDDSALAVVELPVYYSWRFATGAGGDFQSLVTLLKPLKLSAGVGIRDMDVSNAGVGLPAIAPGSPDAMLGLEGALMATETKPRGWTNGAGAAFRAALRKRLETAPPGATDPLVAPPIYGGRHTHQSNLPLDSAPLHWLRELNLDPRYRAIAALGTYVVQQQQEQLMASAWEQVGEIERANQMLRHAQLVRAAGATIQRRHVERLSASQLLQVTRTVHSRVIAGERRTFVQAMAGTNAPGSVTTSAFRRIARPRGAIARRVLPVAERRVRPVVQKLALGTITLFIARPSGGLVTVDSAEERFQANGGTRPADVRVGYRAMLNTDTASIPPRSAFTIRPAEIFPSPPPPPPGLPIRRDSPQAARFRAALIAHMPLIPVIGISVFPVRALPIDELKTTLLARLDPATTVAHRVRAMVRFPGPRDPRDELEPIMAAPEFPQPMYEPLRDLAQDFLLPGLETVADNTVTLLKTNARFVEAYMVGLNHEMARELLWRGYPTDQRGSYFRRFWDVRGRAAGPALDIAPIHAWGAEKRLGEAGAASGGEQLVLLIRGEVLRRYPTAVVYAVAAVVAPGETRPRLGTTELSPLFRGALEPDRMFFGFGLTVKQAHSQPGWFFVIQQQPTEPRFGIDIGADDGAMAFLRPKGNAAATARALLQKPVRIAIHARDLVPSA